jgi:sensor domain CHASE-containing protein
LKKSVALKVAYEIILKFNGSKIIEGYSLDYLGTSPATWDDYQVRFKGNFNTDSLNIMKLISDKFNLKMTAQNNSVIFDPKDIL